MNRSEQKNNAFSTPRARAFEQRRGPRVETEQNTKKGLWVADRNVVRRIVG